MEITTAAVLELVHRLERASYELARVNDELLSLAARAEKLAREDALVNARS